MDYINKKQIEEEIKVKKKIFVLIIIIFLSFIISVTFFMISNEWYFRIFKNTHIKEINGKKYLCIESYSNRLRKTNTYYEKYNIFAYKKTEEYIEDFYDNNGKLEYREYHRIPQTNSVIYYYDNTGNIAEIKTYAENGSIIDIQENNNLEVNGIL